MNLSKCAEEFSRIIDKIPAKVGILHSTNINQATKIAECLMMNEVCGARSWWTALLKLSDGETTFLMIDEYIPDELTAVIRQLIAPTEEIEIFDRRLSEQVRIKLTPNPAKLLIIGNKAILKDMPISMIDGEQLLQNYL